MLIRTWELGASGRGYWATDARAAADNTINENGYFMVMILLSKGCEDVVERRS